MTTKYTTIAIGAVILLLLLFLLPEPLFFLAALTLVLLILFRPSEGSGLSGAFGGSGGDATFGVKTTQTIDKIIITVAVIFIITALVITWSHTQESSDGETSPESRGGPPVAPAPLDPTSTGCL